jgi:peptidyl-prolyl cis-trans isomerase B (cyclophilin B)
MVGRSFAPLALTATTLVLLGCPQAPVTTEVPSPEDNLARLMKLEDERSLGEGEVAARLADPDPLVRARAALALARVGSADAPALLSPLLRDPSAYVRLTSAFGLGILEGELPSETVSELVEALSDEDPRVRGRAAEALARKQGQAAAESIGGAVASWSPKGHEPYDWTEPVTSSLPVEHVDLRLGLFALARIGSLRWSWDALATEGRTPRFAWWPAAWAASELEGDELQPLFLFYAGSPDPVLRLYGARGLGALAPDRASDGVRQLLFDPNDKVRIEAVRAIARLGGSNLVPDLLSHLGADSVYVQTEILKAFAVLRDPATVEPLIDRVGDESPWIRGLALEALAHQNEESFFLLLAGLGSDPSWRVRRSIAATLTSLGGGRAAALVRAMAEDPDARVRIQALEGLRRLDPEGATGALIQHLRANDPFERVEAAEALAELRATDALAPVEQAFVVESDKDPRVRAALLRAIASLDPEGAEPTVRGALEDTSYLLRRTAAEILGAAGATGISVRPRSSERGLDEYRTLMNARYSPQVFLSTSGGTVDIELFITDAPETVANFIRLARGGFFDGQEIEDVVPNDYVSGGDPRGDGKGGPGYTIPSEINTRPVVRGTLLMIEDGRDTGGSRFRITHLPRPDLEGRGTVFGQVQRGMEIVDGLKPGDRIEKVTVWDGVTPPFGGGR